ncbi:MAG: Fe-Mn family superoxide dismutase [bacterium]|nr:Fe-Mn family superoxide dismutase [bacterium]
MGGAYHLGFMGDSGILSIMNYEPKKFNLPTLEGISEKSIEEHIGLYEGYVKNFNAISALLPEYAQDSEKHAHALSELIRRRSFEFGGMRLHELYFPQFEGGSTALTTSGPFAQQVEKEYHKVEYMVEMLKAIAKMRGPGWAVLYWDSTAQQFLTGFTGEQHQGHFVTLPVILALDVWEHAFLLDYGAQGKGKYIDAFFKNINWSVIEKRFEQAV